MAQRIIIDAAELAAVRRCKAATDTGGRLTHGPLRAARDRCVRWSARSANHAYAVGAGSSLGGIRTLRGIASADGLTSQTTAGWRCGSGRLWIARAGPFGCTTNFISTGIGRACVHIAGRADAGGVARAYWRTGIEMRGS